MARIVLIGGHGRVALRLERLLTERGDEVDAIIRNPDHDADVEATGATAVVADVEQLDVDELARLLGGYDAVVWSAGAGGGNPQRTYAVDRDAAIRSIDAAERAGVRRYVMVSYFESPDHSVPESNPFHHYAEAKAAADEHLAATALDWTILGPAASPTVRARVASTPRHPRATASTVPMSRPSPRACSPSRARSGARSASPRARLRSPTRCAE